MGLNKKQEGENIHMKKMMILFLLAVLLFGCTKGNTEVPEETKEDPILYETHTILRQYEAVDLYDTIHLTNLDNLDEYQFKTHVFDRDLTESLELGTFIVRASSAAFNNSFESEKNLYTAHLYQSYVFDRTVVMSYKVTDFSSYLTSTFLSDMQNLEDNLITANDIFSTYGTHVIMSVRNGYKIDLNLTIESHELQPSEFEYIKNLYIDTRPITLPLKDELYLSLESKCRIILEVHTTHNESTLEEVLNDLGTTDIPLSRMFEEDDIIPLFSLFRNDFDTYPNAINKLKARYSELFPGAKLY